MLKASTNLDRNERSTNYDLSWQDLRLLKNAFLKSYAKDDHQLSNETLAALLLSFALRALTHKCADKTISFQSAKEIQFLLKNILAEDVWNAFPTITESAFDEANSFYELHKFVDLFSDIANLGFAYQIFSLGLRYQYALPNIQSANKKITREELIAFTQLYTPTWVVDFLLANTVLPYSAHAEDSTFVPYSSWLINKDADNKKMDTKELSLLDPACGAGQFLFSAFDFFITLYKADGFSTEKSIELILGQNIYGADLDERALWVCGLGLLSKCLLMGHLPKALNLVWVQNNSCQDHFLGSIDTRLPDGHLLQEKYQIIVTNPPYLGRKCMSRGLRAVLKEQYPNSCADLSAAFLERSLQMLKIDGRFGAITQSALMHVPSYSILRSHLIDNYHFETLVNCGPGIFPLSSGEKIDSLLLIIKATVQEKNIVTKQTTKFVDLTREKEKTKKLQTVLDGTVSGAIKTINQESLKERRMGVDVSPLSSQSFAKLTGFPKLGDIAEIKQGLATTDNARFVRYFYDVDPKLIGPIWVPYIKGAGGEKFASINPYLVKWDKNGQEIKEAVAQAYPYLKGKTAWVVKNEQYYFRPGLCFSFINKSGLAVRNLPAGAIFDVASSAIFAQSSKENDFLLAYLNSTLISILAKSINQTINLQVGDLKKLPIIPFETKAKNKLSELGQKCLSTKSALLALEQINFANSIYHELTGLSVEKLEKIWQDHQTKYFKLGQDLEILQKEIDKQVLLSLKQIDILNPDEQDYLNKILDLSSIHKKQNISSANEKFFVGKILSGYISHLMSDKSDDFGSENIVLSSLFHLPEDIRKWLENKLGRSLIQIFYRNKPVDISRLAGQSSRYFSLWIEHNNMLMFFSARALRKHLTGSKLLFVNTNLSQQEKAQLSKRVTSFWQAISKKLQDTEDWTSKDLFSALNQYDSFILS